VPKKAQITQERVEYNVFLFDEPLKGSKLLKIFKISLTFRFDKLSNLSKSVHTGENSQILTVSNKKILICIKRLENAILQVQARFVGQTIYLKQNIIIFVKILFYSQHGKIVRSTS
jgi:hypothetical protein